MIFNCMLCEDTRNLSEVIILNCRHCFCIICFEKYLLSHLSQNIKCPVSVCQTMVEDIQLREILSEDDLYKYDVTCLESLSGVHKCVLPDCGNVIRCTEGVLNYTCNKCSLWNCIHCNATHCTISCAVYRSWSKEEASKWCQTAMVKAKTVFLDKIRLSLFETMKQDLFVNDKVFECLLCCRYIGKGKGIRLRSCFHYLCRPCLTGHIKNTNSIPVRCPDGSCDLTIEEREVKSILTVDEYAVYEAKYQNKWKHKFNNGFQCQQANCDYFCELSDPNIKKFKCPTCKTWNCTRCHGVHPGKTCTEYKNSISKHAFDIEQTIMKGVCMRCPGCDNLVTKSRGCNWIKCPRCDLELCWILKMRRWGPGGRGDTSDGCKCRKNNLCHPTCTGCIPDH